MPITNPSHHAPVFVPYPYRPYWHLNSQSVVPLQDFRRLTQKLDKEVQRVDEYARLIASLSAELRRYQNIVCHTCKEHMIRASLASPKLPHSAQAIATPSIALSEPTDATSSDQVQICTTLAAEPSSSDPFSFGTHPESEESAWVNSPGHPSDKNPDGLVVAASSPDNPQLTVPLSTTTTPTGSAISCIPETPTNAVPTLPNSDHRERFVKYNPQANIKEGLSLQVANTFTFAHRVRCTKFSRDGKYLAVGLQNGETHVYNMVTESKSILPRPSAIVFYTDAPETEATVWSAQFSLDNKYIATVGDDHRINIWELDRRRLRASFKHGIQVGHIDFSPNNRFLVSTSLDLSVCMWRSRDGSRTTLLRHETPEFGLVVFSPDGRYVAVGHFDGFLRIVDTRTCRLVTECVTGYQTSMAFMPDGKGIAIGSDRLYCWDLNFRREIHSGRHIVKDPMKQIFKFKFPSLTRISAISSSDNRWIVASSIFNVYILDARSGALACTLAHKGITLGADSSPAGNYIVRPSGDGHCVRLWRYEMVE